MNTSSIFIKCFFFSLLYLASAKGWAQPQAVGEIENAKWQISFSGWHFVNQERYPALLVKRFYGTQKDKGFRFGLYP